MLSDLVAFFRRAFLRHAPQRYAVMQPQSADRKYDDFPGSLADRQIAAHLEGRAAYAIPYAEAGLAHLLAFDVDAGGLDAHHALMDAATARGLWAFATYDPARGRGYVYVPFADLVNAQRLHALGEQLITETSRPGWKIENRATAEDTRLPFARHTWTKQRGILILPTGQLADLDTDARLEAILTRFAAIYRENPTEGLPPPPEAPQARETRPTPSGPGVTIASYNASTDLVQLLNHYGARRAKGQGARLYFCPLHGDDHASLLISRDGRTCHCLSKGSGCALGEHQHDAFNVFCAAERLTPQQALRRLNGLPDDPEPPRGGNTRPSASKNAQEGPRDARREARPHHPSPFTRPATVRPSQAATAAREPHQLPKTCRRVLAVLAEHPGGYLRGKYQLAELLDVDPRTVQRSLRRLEAEGYITRLERGRDGQTDIYHLADSPCVSYDTQREEGATNRVAPPAETLPEGRQMPPTYELESLPALESSQAERGGNPPAPVPDAEGVYYGPAGAFVYPGGAAFVPPQAEDWYASLPAEVREGEAQAQPVAELKPEQLAALAEEPVTPAKPRRRRQRKAPALDPGRVAGRIIAAERKAAKLEAEGKAKARAQARAIRYQVEQLKLRVQMQQEGYYSAEECDRWHAEQPTAQPPAQADAQGLIGRLRGRLTPAQAPVPASATPGG